MAEFVNTLSLFQIKKYDELFPSIPVLTEQDFFVQFNAYDIYLPKAWLDNSLTNGANGGTLNIFELSILKLLAVNHFTIDELSEKLCLKPDLIKFIIQRLSEMCLIEENRCITDEGNKTVGNTSTALSDEQSVPLVMLVSRDNQQLMPVIFPKSFKATGELVKPYVTMTIGSIGKGKSITGRCIFVKEKGKRASTLEQTQIINAIKAFNRNQPREKKIRYNPNINILSSYDAPIFLHAKGVLQNGYIDRMVASDGFSLHNDFLREYMERQQSDIFKKIKEKTVKSVSTREKSQKYKGKYIEIQKAMEREKSDITNVDERKRAESKERQLVGNLIKAVEWALLYHLRQFPPPSELIQALSKQTPQENAVTTLEFADILGLSTAKNCPKMFNQLSSVAVKNCLKTDNPTLAVHLPISIATAAKVADSHIVDALNTLEKKPTTDKEEDEKEDAFSFLSRIDRYGKEIRHNDEWHPIDGDDANKLYDKVLEFIKVLLPDYDNPLANNDIASNVSLQRLNAELAVSSALGEDLFRALPEDVREQFMKVFSDKWGGQTLPAHEFVGTLSVILEKVLQNLLQELPPISVKKAEIIARLRAGGIASDLNTVKEFYFDQACLKQKATLGAYALAYMAALNDDDLHEFAKRNIHELVYKIANYRGHGNRLGLMVDKNILLNLRKEVLETVKFLGGNYK